MSIVYQHRRNDTNEVFYIGIGKKRDRAFQGGTRKRNKHWNRIVNKVGYTVEILFDDLTYREAIQIEIYLISYYGRIDLKTGNLVNKTSGGEGTFNPSPEHRQAIINSNKTRIISEETKAKIKLGCFLMGEKNGMYGSCRTGKDNPNSKKVIDKDTGIIYDSLKECATVRNLLPNHLCRLIKKNKINVDYV